MKHIFAVFFCILLLSSCFGNSRELEEAKQDMLEPENTQTGAVSDQDAVDNISQDSQEVSEESVNPPMVQISHLTETQLIEIHEIPESDVNDGEIQISGKTLSEVDKITVEFSNTNSSFPVDNYTLQTFKSGDSTFKYNASSKHQVLDYGKNTYIFTAYADGDIRSQTEVSIIVLDAENDTIGFEEKVIGIEGDSVIVDLPKSEAFGEPLSLGVNSFTYSGIEGLEIKKQEVSEITCEGLTDYLSDTINTWYYWNTCRDTIKEKGISFYVIQLTGDDTYTYQKHYVDYGHQFYGIYDVTTGEGVTKENISDKNTELKEANDTFSEVNVVDALMKSIVSQ